MPTELNDDVKNYVTHNSDALAQGNGKLVSFAEVAEAVVRATDTTADLVDLQGWSTVSALSFAALNQAIQEQGLSPKTFEKVENDPDGNPESSIAGTFGPWQLEASGGAEYICFRVPVPSLKLTIYGHESAFTNVDLVIQVKAAFVPRPGSTSQKNLVTAGDSPASIMNEPAIADSNSKGIFKEAMKDWFNENLHTFEVIFSTIDFSADYTAGAMAWIQPSDCDYAVVTPTKNPTLDNSTFGLLTLTDGKKIGGKLSGIVSPYVIPDGCDAVFAISSETFMRHMLLPAVPLMFGDAVAQAAAAENFALSDGGTTITNTKDIQLKKLDLSDEHAGTIVSRIRNLAGSLKKDVGKISGLAEGALGKVQGIESDSVSPMVKAGDFTLTIDGQFLKVSLMGITADFSVGTTISMTYNATYRLVYDPAANGGQGALDLRVVTQTSAISPQTKEWLEDVEFYGALVLLGIGIVGAGFGFAGFLAAGAQATEGAAVGAEEGAEVLVTGVEVASEASETIPETANQGLMGSLRAMRAAAGLPLAQTGVPFATISKIAFGAGLALGLPYGVISIDHIETESDLQKSQIDFLSNARDSLQKTVIWPNTEGAYRLKTIALNGALQFGFVLDKGKASTHA